jgi:hypothetical protein
MRLLAVSLLAFGATSAIAATSTTVYDVFGIASPDQQAGQRWGERLADANVGLGGGRRDLFVSTYLADFPATMHSGAIPAAGEVSLINTNTRALIYEIRSPEPQPNGYFGFYIANIGDVNGDGGMTWRWGSRMGTTPRRATPARRQRQSATWARARSTCSRAPLEDFCTPLTAPSRRAIRPTREAPDPEVSAPGSPEPAT